ncbi:phytanoyl-CoA dioxygenase family protein [uncultured Sphingomonas sp.]|uniref:phytanoyl-CoA dioxygenase family protein n=1 Tax=uncultured Sphingomonas sp. TaxID=158754 RepID=UPI0025FFB2F5|nr:phytanoyl-CoA dioxygenase family protein [uncultured Sphingomonas sp.]
MRAILFDKTAETNWSLAWHQDRTICVRRRIDVDGFGPWTIKGGMQHVAPPFDLLTRMVTLRVHMDDVPATNAPLLIAPASHTDGRIAVNAVRRSFNVEAFGPASLRPETCGCTRLRSCMHPKPLPTRCTDACYNWISRPKTCRAA